MQGILFTIGNPLLDIAAVVTEDFLKKYNLNANDAILADETHKDLIREMTELYEVSYVPGGAGLNTVRIAQWLLGERWATTYMGCIGRDKFGELLETKVKEEGVNAVFMYNEDEPTGTCAACLTGKDRSLVACLGAANKFNQSHISISANKELLEKANYFYVTGFLLTVCKAAALDVAEFSAKNDRLFALNIAAPFICSLYKEQLNELMPYVDVLFGNESEACAFAREFQLGVTDCKEIAERMARFPKKNGKRGRTVVITRGTCSTIVVQGGRVSLYPIKKIDPNKINDTTGAGDSFVGGFLARLVQGGDIAECIYTANHAAHAIIQQPGCTIPARKQ